MGNNVQTKLGEYSVYENAVDAVTDLTALNIIMVVN